MLKISGLYYILSLQARARTYFAIFSQASRLIHEFLPLTLEVEPDDAADGQAFSANMGRFRHFIFAAACSAHDAGRVERIISQRRSRCAAAAMAALSSAHSRYQESRRRRVGKTTHAFGISSGAAAGRYAC